MITIRIEVTTIINNNFIVLIGKRHCVCHLLSIVVAQTYFTPVLKNKFTSIKVVKIVLTENI